MKRFLSFLKKIIQLYRIKVKTFILSCSKMYLGVETYQMEAVLMHVNKDKFVKVVKFETAVKHLSKMVQKEDGEIFFVSDVLYNYEQGLKEFRILENTKNIFDEKLYSDYELIEKSMKTSKDADFESATHIYPGHYYDYWKMGDGRFSRINIEYHESIGWYIDCGCCDEPQAVENIELPVVTVSFKSIPNIKEYQLNFFKLTNDFFIKDPRGYWLRIILMVCNQAETGYIPKRIYKPKKDGTRVLFIPLKTAADLRYVNRRIEFHNIVFDTQIPMFRFDAPYDSDKLLRVLKYET